MKYVWEECDIKVGRRVWSANRASDGGSMIGYDPSIATNIGNRCLISLTDGMVYYKEANGAEMADHLNKHGYRPAAVDQDDIESADA